jgi:hypothetical protein
MLARSERRLGHPWFEPTRAPRLRVSTTRVGPAQRSRARPLAPCPRSRPRMIPERVRDREARRLHEDRLARRAPARRTRPTRSCTGRMRARRQNDIGALTTYFPPRQRLCRDALAADQVEVLSAGGLDRGCERQLDSRWQVAIEVKKTNPFEGSPQITPMLQSGSRRNDSRISASLAARALAANQLRSSADHPSLPSHLREAARRQSPTA